MVHVDASLIRADVSWESFAMRHVAAVAEVNSDEPSKPEEELRRRYLKKTGKYKKVCTTDPDATMATTARNRRVEPSYKQHSIVDDVRGVVLDVEVTTGDVNQGDQFLDRLDAAAAVTGAAINVVTVNAGYAYAKIFSGLKRRAISAAIPTKVRSDPQPGADAAFSLRCRARGAKVPAPQAAEPGRSVKHDRFLTSPAGDCRRCELAALCPSKGPTN